MKTILKTWLLLFAVLLSFCGALSAETKSAQATEDPVLRALRLEMERSKTQLRLENMSAPYFIDYRVLDLDAWDAEAALGGVRSETRMRVRFLLVQVRLGDYQHDNSSARGEGAIELAPLDDNEQAFRFQVWIATDQAYKQAIEALTSKQARLKQLTIDHPVDDFAHAEPVQSLQPVAVLKVDREPWLKMLREASGLYTGDPKVESLGTSLYFAAVNRYYLNSEGTQVRSGQELYQMQINGSTQAEDGMRLTRGSTFTANSQQDLPTPAVFRDRAADVVSGLKQLREAQLADEEYHGPVLFSASSSTVVFSSIIGNNVLGNKPALGQNARVLGQFASSYKTRVLPDFLNVVDDPTLATAAGKTLLGHYDVDDEGVKPQRVSVIEKGVLTNYLLGREPIRDFPVSNGHGRATLPGRTTPQWPRPALGNLLVQATEGVTFDELKKKLIEICKDRGLEYGYYVKSISAIRTPPLLYRVWANDGHEELVRGAVFGDLDQRSLRSDILSAGNDTFVRNEIQPVPHSVMAPSILFDDLEIKRQTTNKEKLPEYPAPEIAKQ